jgi:hypothetical protein
VLKESLDNNHSTIKLEEFNLQGTVFFKGLPCNSQDLKVPPCSGPYPDYKVIVYSGNNEEIDSTITNDKGEFKLFLPNGKYNIFTQAGHSQSMQKSNYFIIEGKKIVSLNLVVHTGIR